jgi:hypothetical protein
MSIDLPLALVMIQSSLVTFRGHQRVQFACNRPLVRNMQSMKGLIYRLVH